MAHIAAAAAPVHRDPRRLHVLRAVARRPDRRQHRDVERLGVREQQLRRPGLQQPAHGPDARDPGLAGAEVYM